MNVKEKDSAYIAHTYARFPLVAMEGKNALCRDPQGKEYVDFSSGIGVNSLGFCNEEWAEAVSRQAHTLQHISNLYYSKPMTELGERLCKRTFAKKVFFANSGAEANEGMIKAARKYSSDKYGPGRHTIIALENSFHGRTIATLSATGQDTFHKHFGPFVEGFRFVPAGDTDALRKAAQDGVCGILLEMIQGEGGVVPLDETFVAEAAKICGEKDILLMVDEVQTGVGRTGKLLCCEHFGVTPDLASLAKGIGGGLPLGAVLLGEKCENTLGGGDHGTTFGGNPIACAGACVILDKIDEKLLAEVLEKGAYLKEAVLKMPHVKSVEGLGLMLGITLEEGLDSKKLAKLCVEQGLIILTAKKKLRMLPPLTITWEEIKRGLNSLNEVLNKV